jgi:hypothetical protein
MTRRAEVLLVASLPPRRTGFDLKTVNVEFLALRTGSWFCPTTIVQYPFIYRVSIKSFPDYKHLLQENYVEYKHIFYLF